ncbi:DUF2326 domain-containing protein [Priestia sp. JSM ZJ58]|uniref:DUF2326 domain-containing protein n=1 Tax=Priestia sp. JSM ZJ58 TaxID=3376189 RepID=UPI0037BAC21E
MKLNKLYSSHPEYFETINFNKGLNIVLAEVRDPSNTSRSTHDLGKSLLASLIDYCLLKEIKKDFFLYKHYDRFEEFTFYLEIALDNGHFCTIKRSVKRKSKIFINVSSEEKTYNFNSLWDFNEGIKKAKEYLDKLLSFEILPNKSYRTLISYFLRDQASFMDVFRLSKFSRSNDIEWKPIVAELLGIDSKNIITKYTLDNQTSQINSDIKKASKNELQSKEQEDKFKTVLRIKKELVNQKETELNSLNFKKSDNDKIEKLVNYLDKRIQVLLKENYYKASQIKNAEDALINYEEINLEEIQNLYKEIGVYFQGQIVRDYKDLIEFNNQIFEERNEILKEILKESRQKYEMNSKEIKILNDEKSNYLTYITSKDSFEKLYLLEKEIIDLKVQVEQLEEKLSNIDTTHNLEIEKQNVETNISKAVLELKKDIYKENHILNSIRKHFSDIIVRVLGDAATISVSLNNKKNIEFKPEIFDLELNSESSKDKGTTYKKLMCCAFDLALLATYSNNRFFHFVYHDSIFDGLDKRQKENLIQVINYYISKYNIQYIFSTIEDELPPSLSHFEVKMGLVSSNVVIKTLHDYGNEGRLFKMDSF